MALKDVWNELKPWHKVLAIGLGFALPIAAVVTGLLFYVMLEGLEQAWTLFLGLLKAVEGVVP